MTASILVTKLFIPPIRPALVPRPNLIKQLNDGLARKLTLISAPAGFGKTTLVSEWAQNLRLMIDDFRLDFTSQIVNRQSKSINQIAWLSLDEGDNDPVRFLSYFITVLNQIEGTEDTFGKGTLSMLQSPQPPPTQTVLTSLINELAAITSGIIFVLDDYHLIEAQPIHDALTFLLENLPPQLHLVIATREDPNLPIARLRARGQLTELRAADLRFSSSEAAEFLNQIMGLNLATEEIAALETRTEGWIAGLQLAAVSLRGSIDTSRLIQSFTGSHRLVLDYLLEEVLNQQPESVQNFLLKTAVLDRLTGPLCDAVCSVGTAIGQDNGQETLEMLDRTNLFVVPLDEERRWYRYHRLFADLLRQRLKQTQKEQMPILHRKASEWYEQNGFVDEAIEHALRSEDNVLATTMIDEHADALWGRGEHAKLKRWLDKLPAALVCSKPRVCIFHAWYMFASGQHDAADRCLQAVDQAIDASAAHTIETEPQDLSVLSTPDRVNLQGRVAAIRSFIDSHRGDIPGMIQHAHQALEYLPEHDRTWRGIIAIVLGDVYGFKGDMTAACKARFEAVKTCKAAGDSYYVMLASMKLAITLRSQGHLQRTIDICQEQIQIANECGLTQTPLNGLLLIIWGEVLVELNDLDLALDHAQKGIVLTENFADMGFLGWGYICMIRILFTRGELAGAEKIIQKIETTARESNVPPWVKNQIVTWRTRLRLAQGKLDAASQWVKDRELNTDGKSKPLQEIDFFSLFDYIMLARVLIAQGKLDEAARLLKRLLKPAEMNGRTTRVIEILMLQALVLQAREDINQAIIQLEQALTLAEPEGFIRIFVDEGPPMALLLQEALSRSIALKYVRQLLAAFPDVELEKGMPSNSQLPDSELIEPLSERELEVLQLIAEGLTNPEIAARLFLSLNTVKVHTRNIYGKLDVHSRTQAVARARALGILST